MLRMNWKQARLEVGDLLEAVQARDNEMCSRDGEM